MTNLKKINRRNFLKASATIIGAGIAASTMDTPTKAIASSSYPAEGADREIDSCCHFCQVRCTTKVKVKEGRVVDVYGNPDNFWTGGAMCPKGKSMVDLTYSPHRVLYPLLREGESWKQISYKKAMEIIAEKILEVKKNHPKEFAHRLAMFEPCFDSRESEIAAKLALNMAGFPDLCSPGDVCIGNTSATLYLCLGSGISPTTLKEVLNSEVLIIFGANIAEIKPPYMRWLHLAKEKGVKIIYLDPRRTPTANFCDFHIMPRPGTDGALVLGIIRILIEEKLYDKNYCDLNVNGFDELIDAVVPYTPEKVEEITWIPAEKVVNLARMLGNSKRTIAWMGGSISRYTNAMQTVRTIVALQAIMGNLIGTGKGIMTVRGGKPGGEDGLIEKYQAPDLAPRLSSRKVLFNIKRGKLDLLIMNSSYRRYPDSDKLKEAISKVNFVVYRGFFMDEEVKLAHLFIPATMVYESEGSQYGAQRQVVWRNQAIPRPGETVEDWRFYCDLGRLLNKDRFPPVKGPQDIYEMVREISPEWRGLSIERIKKSPTGITWPNYSLEEPDLMESLYRDNRFFTQDGKVQLNIPIGKIGWVEPEGGPDAKKDQGFPLIFIQGKVGHHWQQTVTNWSPYLAQFSEGNYVQVHPDTITDLDVKEGDWVYLETEIGRIKAKLKITRSILPGVVWTPSHPAPSPYSGNSGVPINKIIPDKWDKVAAQFNGYGCRLVKT
jgi:formate dehydrogenase (coenzyme F420) alpha subunit